MRLFITIAALVVYLTSISLYILKMGGTDIQPQHLKLWYNYTTLAMVIFYIVDVKAGIHDYLHEKFNNICILSVIFNYILIILTHHGILLDPLSKFTIFNGAILFSTILVLISAYRNGYFKKQT